MLPVLLDPSLQQLLNIKHGFFTRLGGTSIAHYATLNCDYNCGDSASKVKYNRQLIASYFNTPLTNLVTVKQIHSNKVVTIKHANHCSQNVACADGIVSNLCQIVLGATSADCPIVLLAEPHKRIIGIAHAGWRGAKSGILAAIVEAMQDLGGKTKNIVAAISPCINQLSYQISYDLFADFCQLTTDNAQYFVADTDNTTNIANKTFYFDLLAYVKDSLLSLKIASVSTAVAYDTYSAVQQFFSYRRACHRQQLTCGRQMSAIMLCAEP
jgi:YfiH family protein